MLSFAIARPIRVNGEHDVTRMREESMNRSFLCFFLRGTLTTFAMTAILFGAFSAARAQAQANPQNLLDGNWKNIDPHTRGIDVIVIAGKKVHPFGACHPKDCDWGVLKLKPRKVASSGNPTDASKLVATHPTQSVGYDRMASISYYYSELVPWKTVEFTISLLPDGRLRVDTLTRFIDGSSRAKFGAGDYFRPSVSPFAP